ncbi:hypothetical protein CAOG_08557 [Capsaspora owczarzaki ATCC 30864]|uniref:Cyclin-like domain-containing protein n=1 Tax=Capsaspora owczarzaki (strain ATCC 30864) TaxID=595528 RepID=A0A0D2VKM7_CAPO3|nr:hypothetical protein CAOG_08557 [Capsaspora owczarzaki ATCC 30864]KJE90582.1 hypothetical protein CAOG_008557 [Capsaspora owczarzaki ATCC 30864]|eukprot:XP_011270139.1 hypothetical protein CAOG_08557 [Capsaspora owczarzaki ATCC 30864]
MAATTSFSSPMMTPTGQVQHPASLDTADSRDSGARWYYSDEELDKTPSREDGISAETEMRYRLEGVALIKEIGQHQQRPMSQQAIATGIVFFHRFFMCQSFKDFEASKMACTCLLLAGKVEESHRKCYDILDRAHVFRQTQQLAEQIKQSGGVVSAEQGVKRLGRDSREYYQAKEEMLVNERILLQAIAFELAVEHPYPFVMKFCKKLKRQGAFAQLVWNYVNDSLRTTLCLRYKPVLIAVAAMHLAAVTQRAELPNGSNGEPWWKLLDADLSPSLELIQYIASVINDLYEKP